MRPFVFEIDQPDVRNRLPFALVVDVEVGLAESGDKAALPVDERPGRNRGEQGIAISRTRSRRLTI